MRLKLKNVEWKKFLLEKGERVALYGCLGIMGLMLIFGLFMPGKGVFSESGNENARKLKDQNDVARRNLQNNKPDETRLAELTTIPDTLLRSGELAQADPRLHRSSVMLWAPSGSEDSKRRQPRLIGPTEFTSVVVQVPVSTFIFDRDVKRIMILKGQKGLPNQQPRGSTPKNLGKTYDEFKKSGHGNQFQQGEGVGRQPPRPDNPTINQQPPEKEGALTPKAESKTDWVFLDDLAKMESLKDARFAEDLQSVRMAILVGSFPLREQVRKFQQALRLSKLEQVFAERPELKGPQFQFLGLNIQRRVVGSARADWVALDMENSYIPLIVRSGKRFVEDKADLKQVMYDGLIMMRPVLPPGREDLYPDVERQLKTIQATLEELKKQTEEGKPIARPDRRFTKSGYDPFRSVTEEPEKEPEKPMTNVKEGQEWLPPEHCLIRFLDLNLDPGKTYEYRVQIRMVNPNYLHTNVVQNDLKVQKELISEWFPVNDDQGKPVQVTVPPEAFFYVTDGPRPPEATKNQVVVQFHRWLRSLTPPGNKETEFSVAEWVVADQVLVNRGEYLRREEEKYAPRIEVPIWMYNQGQFVLANNPHAYYPIDRQRVPVPFSPGTGDYVLVDFQGGNRLSYSKLTEIQKEKPSSMSIADKSPVELLYLSPDGKLLARDSEVDRRDPERERRHQLYKDRVAEARDPSKKADPKKPGGS